MTNAMAPPLDMRSGSYSEQAGQIQQRGETGARQMYVFLCCLLTLFLHNWEGEVASKGAAEMGRMPMQARQESGEAR
jgi:hypothetical protein